MKSFNKFCLILAGVFVVLGIIGVTAGMALGARPGQFLNMVHYRNSGWPLWWRQTNVADLTEDWLDDSLEDAGDWLEDSLDDSLDDLDDRLDGSWDWSEDVWRYWEDPDMKDVDELKKLIGGGVDTFEGDYGSPDTRKLKLDLNSSFVKIYTYDREEIRIEGANAQRYLKILENGDTLTLEDHRKSRKKPLILVIYLPQRQLENLDFDMGASEFYASELSAEKITIDMGAGEAKAESLNAEKVEMGLGAGIFTVRNIEAEEKAVLNVGTGELVVERFAGGDLELDCGIGHISLTATGKESDYNYTLDCGIGSLELNGKSYSGLGREQNIDNQASKKIAMECGIGEIELNFED